MDQKIENCHFESDAKMRVRQLSTPFANCDRAPHIAVMNTPRVTIWFDGDCPLCVAEISLMRRLDAKKGAVAFVDLTGDGTCPLDRGDMLAKFHAQETGKPVVSGAGAFAAMWRHVTPFQPLGWLATIPPCLWAMNLAYVQFLRVRPRLQKWMAARQPGL